MSDTITTTFIVGKYRKPVEMRFDGTRIWLTFGYNKLLIEEIKNMEGAKWHGFDDTKPIKKWSIKNTARNRFQIAFLEGKNPYRDYDADLVTVGTTRPLFKHQHEMVSVGVTRKQVILACEMGTGKSLAAIEIMEFVQRKYGITNYDAWYVGPKSGVFAVGRELVKWQSAVKPIMMTYDRLSIMAKEGFGKPPRILILDESSKLKTPTTQRTIAAMTLVELMREKYNNDCYIILMSGTPAPKTPVDWWSQTEIACPGFLKEGNIHRFKARMCVIEERQSITGGVYPHVVTWLDDEKKCNLCGQDKSNNVHDSWYEPEELAHIKDEQKKFELLSKMPFSKKYHEFVQSKNEVEFLYKRMKGLVLVKFKKECTDLPDKFYRVIELTPPADMVRAMKLIKAKSTRAIEAITLLRELSDGFQYTETKVGEETCDVCFGKKVIEASVPVDGPVDIMAPTSTISREDFKKEMVECDRCGGTGVIPTYARKADCASSPKDDVFIDLLDEHDDVGRFIVWGGFTGTIDRLTEMAHKYGWATLRVDGRGFIGTGPQGESLKAEDLLDAMDASNPRFKKLLEAYPKICFVGHPQAGGMALTLTASPTELFYSNCFNGEARMQAEDRFHRPGMDKNKGATIIDILLLPTDKLILDNLKKKKKLQSLTMGELETAIQ